ncbi:TPA: replication initiation protein, partial [Clostridioides difficile]
MAKKQNYIWRNDRNFDLDEYEQQQYYYVAESNDLITKARHDLTARELKIMDFVISKIQPDDKEFVTINTSMYELTKVLNLKRSGTTYSDLAKNLDSLGYKRVVIYNDKERSITQTSWVMQSKYWENGQVE